MKSSLIYTKKDYESSDGMLTTVWGPALWHVLHTISFNYPVNPTKQDKKHYSDFIYQLRYILPCKYCRINLTNNLKKYPLTDEHMKSRSTFSHYIYNLHQIVNHMLHKKNNLTYKKIRDRYEHFRARCTQKSMNQSIHSKGCTEPFYGMKSKCLIHIIPQTKRKSSNSILIDKKCIKHKIYNHSYTKKKQRNAKAVFK